MSEDTTHRPDVTADTVLADAVATAVASYAADRGPLLPVLHAVQADLGWLPPQVTPLVAKALNLSRAEVHGVITFYTDFRDQPPPRRTVRICGAEACQSVGARQLVRHAADRLGIEVGETTAGGEIGLEQVFCLGNCALGPAAQVNGRLYGRLDEARLSAILDTAVSS
jgi:formate dehydrogenase subunit gamma